MAQAAHPTDGKVYEGSTELYVAEWTCWPRNTGLGGNEGMGGGSVLGPQHKSFPESWYRAWQRALVECQR